MAYKPATLVYFYLSVQWHLNTKGSMVNLHKDNFKLSCGRWNLQNAECDVCTLGQRWYVKSLFTHVFARFTYVSWLSIADFKIIDSDRSVNKKSCFFYPNPNPNSGITADLKYRCHVLRSANSTRQLSWSFKILMKALLVQYGKGHHVQITLDVRKTEADKCFAEG